MRIILLIVSFIVIIFTFTIFYIGIYDEIYQKLEKNKLWFSDGSFGISLGLLLLSIFCSVYIFKNFFKKSKINQFDKNYHSVDQYKMELIKHNKNYRWFHI